MTPMAPFREPGPPDKLLQPAVSLPMQPVSDRALSSDVRRR